MSATRIGRLPKRIRDDLKIVTKARNWRQILRAKLTREPISSIELRNGVILNAPPQIDLNFLFHEIWIDEFYAPTGYEIRPGETIVDIGGNIGVFATWAATKQPRVRVLSFEPFPANAKVFQANQQASRLDNIEFRAAAVGSSDGRRTLRVEDSWILHSLAAAGSTEGGVEVDCVSLDTALADVERCDFLKLDCEGGEYEALYSAAPQTISKVGRIVCEYNRLDEDERNGQGLSRFLVANGFAVDEIRELDATSGFICARRRDRAAVRL